MGFCPNCGSWVDEGDICHGCGAVFGYGDDCTEDDILIMSCSAERERKRGDLKESTETYERIIEILDRGDACSYDSFASYYVGIAEKAIAEMKPELAILEEAEKKAKVLSDDAWSLYNDDCPGEALSLINRATEIYPRVANDFNRKALILDSMGRYEEASHSYDEALSLKPYSKIILKNKALMLSFWADQLLENSKSLPNGLDLLNQAYEKIKAAIEILSENNDEDLDSFNQKKKSIEFYLELERDFQEKLETVEEYGRDELFTITGMEFYENYTPFYRGLTLKLVKEPKNKFDSEAIAIYVKDKKIGYVANSDYTTYELTSSASELQDKIGNDAKGKYVCELRRHGEISYHIGRIKLE